MDIQIILQELDTLFAKKKMTQVEPFLQTTLGESLAQEDYASAITITNELIGFYRDTSQYEKAEYYCEQVVTLMNEMGLQNTIPYATTLLNVANAYRASGKLVESLENYEKVHAIYQEQLDTNDFLYASFYNNVSLLYQELQEFEKATECLEHALHIVSSYKHAVVELATTHTNLAVSLLRCQRIEKAMGHIKLALELFENEKEKDFHYSAALSAMGEAQYFLQNYELAEQYYKKALQEMQEQHLGTTASYQTTEANLARVYEKQGKQNISGIELNRRFYEEYGKPMIKKKFAAYQNQIAAGLVGEGSECFGYDDELSKDHDFGPGFCLWLTKEVYQKIGAKLQAEYEKLPTTFCGITRKTTKEGSHRVGVFEIGEFYESLLGCNTAPNTEPEWMVIPEDRLATAINGEIFFDPEHAFSLVREKIATYYPATLWHKLLAQEAALIAQAGQYNYERMLKRKELVSASLACSEFVLHTMKMVYLLNRTFAPYYKWMHRGIKTLPRLSKLAELLTTFCETTEPAKKLALIQIIVDLLIAECKVQGLTAIEDSYLGHHVSFLLNDRKRNLITKIISREWEAFDKVQNKGGRADCQEDFTTFEIMRKSQYMTWTEELLEQYLIDFELALAQKRNLISEKYAWMMESTTPEEFSALKTSLPELSPKNTSLIDGIVSIQVKWMEEFSMQYPKMSSNARVIHKSQDTLFRTSYETYLQGELKTYSDQMLYLYGCFIASMAKENQNLAKVIMTNTAILYGYSSLEDAEKQITD